MVCWPGWRSHHLARGRADQRGQDLGSAWMNGDDVGEVMWAPVQRTGQGDAGRLGGKMQVQALTHPRSNGKRDAGRKARQQRKPLTGEASHASAVQEAAQQQKSRQPARGRNEAVRMEEARWGRFPAGRLLHCTLLALRRHARKTALDAAGGHARDAL
jgi:hypothetical protein